MHPLHQRTWILSSVRGSYFSIPKGMLDPFSSTQPDNLEPLVNTLFPILHLASRKADRTLQLKEH